jgi:hypothetical protein
MNNKQPFPEITSTNYFVPIKVFVLALFFLVIACGHTAKRHEKADEAIPEIQPPIITGYDFLQPKMSWALPDELKEISGLARVDNSHFIAIEDLHPLLYLLRIDSTCIVERVIPFKQTNNEKFDIEDVTIKQDTVYAIWSHGEIFRISNWKGNPAVHSFTTSLTKEDNTEGICYDSLSNSLLIACKNKSGVGDEKKSTRAIYAFDMKSNSLRSAPFLLIHKKDFEKIAGEKIDFFPSGIAVHPLTNDIYILSTKENKCLAVYDRNDRLKSFIKLDKELLPQPEGMCFAPDGKLYISSQGKHGKRAVIYEFDAVK